MHLHGCTVIVGDSSPDTVSDSGILQYAASNDLVVIFPQAVESEVNDGPCFHSSIVFPDEQDQDKYLTNEAVQNKALKAMLDRGIEARDTE